MAQINLQTEIDGDIEAFWRDFFTDPFEQFQLQYMNVQAIDLVSEEAEGAVVNRVVKVTPDVPAAIRAVIAKLLGKNELCYLDRQVKNLQALTIDFDTEPPIMKDSITIGGTFKAEPVTENRFRLFLNGRADIKIFLVGGLIENAILAELKKTFEVLPTIIESWQKRS